MGRKRIHRLTKKNKELKDSIIKLMKEKNIYENTDEFMIDQLLFNLYLAEEATSDIIARGVSINVRTDPEADPYYQPNPSNGIYQQAIKQVVTLSTKLGLTPQERQKLGIVTKEKNQTDFLDDE